MRLLHTSDWHLGRTLFQVSLLDHQAAFLDWLLAEAQARDVDAVLVSGDVYDRAIPHVQAVELLDRTLLAFSEAGIPLVLVSGNHDSAVRLGFASGLATRAGVHLRTEVAQIGTPLVLDDEHGPVAVYGIPYLLPDAVMDELGAERSHESVLRAATGRALDDARARGIERTVLLGHAFVTGGQASESERDIRVGGIGDAPASVFDGATYVALGHLHRPQQVRLTGSGTTIRYSGSPLAFSFGEKDDEKSVALVEIGADGTVEVETLPVPVPRPLREVRGRLDDLLADGSDPSLADAWVKVVLTDARRPEAPMERLRAHWPHTLVLEFSPEVDGITVTDDLARLRSETDPLEICAMFVEYVDREEPSEAERALLRRAVELTREEAGA